jgi:hypothetical protein
VAHFLFIDESGFDSGPSPYGVLGGVAIEDRDVWNLIKSMQDAELRHFGIRYSARPELAGFASQICPFRNRAIREVRGNPRFAIWSLAYITDLRSQAEREVEPEEDAEQ